MPDNSLYHRILGSSIALLPQRLRAFHVNPAGGTAHGTASIVRGTGLCAVLARLMGLPRPGDGVPVIVDVRTGGGREIWDRTFGGRLLRTTQWQHGAHLAEQKGPVTMLFDLKADSEGLTFHYHACRVFGIPIPRRLTTHVNARITGTDTGWHLEVIISSPLLGLITSYRGTITTDA